MRVYLGSDRRRDGEVRCFHWLRKLRRSGTPPALALRTPERLKRDFVSHAAQQMGQRGRDLFSLP